MDLVAGLKVVFSAASLAFSSRMICIGASNSSLCSMRVSSVRMCAILLLQ
jgi:hypothetical protein